MTFFHALHLANPEVGGCNHRRCMLSMTDRFVLLFVAPCQELSFDENEFLYCGKDAVSNKPSFLGFNSRSSRCHQESPIPLAQQFNEV